MESKNGWHPLTRLDSDGLNYATRFKILYSAKGIYVLFDGEDNRITTSFDQDFQDLFKADVFEVFSHPDTTMPLYLEYEINALNKELFFPYGIFSSLQNVPPASGTVWHANFYRLDYDSGSMVKWSWAPIEHSFHEFR